MIPGDKESNSDVDTTTQTLIPVTPRHNKDQAEAQSQSEEESQEESDHKLLIAIAYKVRKLDGQNEKIVKALKQNNRYLHSVLRHVKALLAKQDKTLTLDNENWGCHQDMFVFLHSFISILDIRVINLLIHKVPRNYH